MRIRIALATAIAVIASPAIFFAFFSSTPAASARTTRHEAISQHRAVKIDFKPMSYTQARKVATMVNYANAVEAGKVDTYLAEVAYLKAVAAQNQQKAAAAQATATAAAQATAAANAAAQARAVAQKLEADCRRCAARDPREYPPHLHESSPPTAHPGFPPYPSMSRLTPETAR